jgi:hypothetical protein
MKDSDPIMNREFVGITLEYPATLTIHLLLGLVLRLGSKQLKQKQFSWPLIAVHVVV